MRNLKDRSKDIISGRIKLEYFDIIQYMDMSIRIQWNLEAMDLGEETKKKFVDVIGKFYDKYF